MKKAIGILMAAMMLTVMLCACGSTETADNTATNTIQASKKPSSNGAAKTEAKSIKEEPKQPELVDSGYTVLEPNSIGDIYLTYVVKVKNPNKDMAAVYTDITITGKNEDGTILFSNEDTIPLIMPGDTVAWAEDTMDCKNKVPATVEITVGGASFNTLDEIDDGVVTADFSIENLSIVDGDWGASVTGEITNNSDVDCDDVIITVIYLKDDKMVGGYHSYQDDMSAGKKAAFDVSSWGLEDLDYDELEVLAQAS